MGVAANAVDYIAKALRAPQDKFVATCPFPFLIGKVQFVEEEESTRTGSFDTKEEHGELFAPNDRARPLVLAVRKKKSVFADMITVGRASNNDVVVRARGVSKFHAFFRVQAGHAELADAGSRNGTWIGRLRLPSKGSASAVKSGDSVRFGSLEFRFLDAAALWIQLHSAQ